jgi:hypothetical protein
LKTPILPSITIQKTAGSLDGKFLREFGGLTRFAACDLPVWLAATTRGLDDAMRAGTTLSQLLNLRVFQQYLREADMVREQDDEHP